jgi:hypothetical protein
MTAVDDKPVRVERPALGAVRCVLIALGALSMIGAGTELASQGVDAERLVPWTGLAMLAVAAATFALPHRRAMLWARLLCLVVLCAAAYGVAEHLLLVADPAGIDESIGDFWASLSPLTRSWYGADDLGPSTPLAPGMLGQAALLLLLATLGRPSTRATV